METLDYVLQRKIYVKLLPITQILISNESSMFLWELLRFNNNYLRIMATSGSKTEVIGIDELMNILNDYDGHNIKSVAISGRNPGMPYFMRRIMATTTVFPSIIFKLTNLQQLDINNTSISILPPEIGNLTSLIDLRLIVNLLDSLPSQIGKLTNLKSLDLTRNEITSLPSTIGDLINLQSLDVTKNKLTNLPIELFRLTNLQYLSLAYNEITFLPSEIGNLNKLINLILTNNKLTELPPQIGNLTNLYRLDIYGNEIYNLPREISNIYNLERDEIYLSGGAKLIKIVYLFLPKIMDNEQSRQKIKRLLPHNVGLNFVPSITFPN